MKGCLASDGFAAAAAKCSVAEHVSANMAR